MTGWLKPLGFNNGGYIFPPIVLRLESQGYQTKENTTQQKKSFAREFWWKIVYTLKGKS